MKMTEKNRAVLAEAIARAWKDGSFRKLLKSAPKKTLLAGGMDIPADMDIIVLENTPSVTYAILPTLADQPQFQAKLDQAMKRISNLPESMELRVLRDTAHVSHVVIPNSPASGALSDSELQKVSGGGSTATTTVQTQTTVTTTTVGAEAEVEVVAVVAVAVVPCFIT
jgi:hypothetical protein